MMSSGASSISKYTNVDNSNPRDGRSYLRARRSLARCRWPRSQIALLRDQHYPHGNVLHYNLTFQYNFGTGFSDQLTEQTRPARRPFPTTRSETPLALHLCADRNLKGAEQLPAHCLAETATSAALRSSSCVIARPAAICQFVIGG